jgi:hypothetical protein
MLAAEQQRRHRNGVTSKTIIKALARLTSFG